MTSHMSWPRVFYKLLSFESKEEKKIELTCLLRFLHHSNSSFDHAVRLFTCSVII